MTRALLTTRPRSDVGFTCFSHTRHPHTERIPQHQQAGAGRQHVRRPRPAGPGHKQRELAGLSHLCTGLQLHPAARRNRRQDPGRGGRHHNTGPRQVADAVPECHSRGIGARFRAVAYDSGPTLPHMYAKRRISGPDFAKNRPKTEPDGHPAPIGPGFLDMSLNFAPSPGVAGGIHGDSV